ncbi:uncharacterized protein CLUP02_06907 [Colletotrichum lupini]|uniref:Uncharacterized protein n=1 Tax=Colletotrichum lupini TaxID=145971 RepID=A0A9Q8SQ49_9PEZI|nr:uncharacterized protein CLUP02_06907 [Colletotrichum lupini]UQC81421.1 hypothetical protein CLUP02_06907 [Colletotrichum lupini]
MLQLQSLRAMIFSEASLVRGPRCSQTECIPNWGLHGRIRFWDFCRFCSSLSLSCYTR